MLSVDSFVLLRADVQGPEASPPFSVSLTHEEGWVLLQHEVGCVQLYHLLRLWRDALAMGPRHGKGLLGPVHTVPAPAVSKRRTP